MNKSGIQLNLDFLDFLEIPLASLTVKNTCYCYLFAFQILCNDFSTNDTTVQP